MKLQAHVIVDDYMAVNMQQDYLKNYVLRNLESVISKEVVKHMTITQQKDPINAQTLYTGSLTVSNSNPYIATTSTTPSYTITTTSTNPNAYYDVQLNLRVVEYTKGGKVTRVELQYLDDEDWHKVPRIQIEE